MEIPNIYFPYLGWAFHINSVAFEIFGISVYWYGLIMAVAILSGAMVSCWIGKKEGLPSEIFMDYVLITLPFALAGARFYFVIFHWQYSKVQWQEILDLRRGGIAIYGAVIASVIVALFYTRYKKVSFLHFADISVLGLVLGQAIGRYGNFFNKEAFGSGTDSLLAMALLKSAAKGPFTESVLKAAVIFPQFGNAVYLQVHPTFLYESCWNLLLFAVLLLYRKHRQYKGMLFFIYLIGYGIGRFWIEALRTDQLVSWIIQVPVSQIVAIISIGLGIIGIFKCRMEKERIKL